MTDGLNPPDPNVYQLFPEWFAGWQTPETLSDELRARIARWNEVWENELNPIEETSWPDPDVGRAWIAEGDELVRLMQRELGPEITVVESFHMYAPRP